MRVNATLYNAARKQCSTWFYVEFTQSDISFTTQHTEHGYALLSFPVPTITEKIELQVSAAGVSFSETLYAIAKGNDPMLRIDISNPDVRAGHDLVVTAEANVPISGVLTLEMYSRGDMVAFMRSSLSRASFVAFNVHLTEKMVPHAVIIVSHITATGEILSDNAVVYVSGSPLANQVSVSFNTTNAQPGQPIAMTFRAAPHSTVYYMAVDERNQLLASGNDIDSFEVTEDVLSLAQSWMQNINQYPTNEKRSVNPNDAFRSLERRSFHEKYLRYRKSSSRRSYGKYGDTDDGYIQSGIHLLTDAKVIERQGLIDLFIFKNPLTVWTL
ncbi:uncharacterized protein LOC128221608 [Mya arenaria]|uniref:uncharacterized protein LOC128221608 n=1 Tax=Mya arenaria TaxID=6604 RepID=UPI0022E97342|nr:uncharacterized protein LOC128221608 [Mya arenaria]